MAEQLELLLLVHDLKTPLAVIRSGAAALTTREVKYGPLSPLQRAALDGILRHSKGLQSDIDRILALGRSACFPSGGWLKRVMAPAAARTRHRGHSRIRQLLEVMAERQSAIRAGIDRLDTEASEGSTLSPAQQTVVNRLKRSAKSCRILIENAGLLAAPGRAARVPRAMGLADALRGPLIEIFDLQDESIAERLTKAATADGLIRLAAEGGLAIDAEAGLLKRRCVLEADKFGRVLANLLLNAFRHRRSKVWLSLRSVGPDLVLEVADDGPGMTAETLNAVRSRRRVAATTDGFPVAGHGIGLAGAQLLSGEMGGALTIDSTAGGGTRATLRLPLGPGAEKNGS